MPFRSTWFRHMPTCCDVRYDFHVKRCTIRLDSHLFRGEGFMFYLLFVCNLGILISGAVVIVCQLDLQLPICKRCRSITTKVVSSKPVHGEVYSIQHCDKACQWLAIGRSYSPGTSVSSTNKTNRHYITEILLKVALNNINQPTVY